MRGLVRTPPRDLVELRANVTRDIGGRVRHPEIGLLDSTASGQAAVAKRWRQFISTSIDGLARRLEAQILDQLGVEVCD